MKTTILNAFLLLLLLVVPIAVSIISLYTNYDVRFDFKKEDIVIRYLARLSESFNYEIEQEVRNIKAAVNNLELEQLKKTSQCKILPPMFFMNEWVLDDASPDELKKFFTKRSHVDAVITETSIKGFYLSYLGTSQYVFVLPADERQQKFYVFLFDLTRILDRITGRKIFSNFSAMYINSKSEILIPSKYLDVDTKNLSLIVKNSEAFNKLKDVGITENWSSEIKDTQINVYSVQTKSIYIPDGKFVGLIIQKDRLNTFLNEYRILFYEFGLLIPMIFVFVVLILLRINMKSVKMLDKLQINVREVQKNPYLTDDIFQMKGYEDYRNPIMNVLNEVRFQQLQINTFDEVGFVMLNIFDINTLLKAVIKSIEKILKATRTSIVLVNEKDGSFYIKMASGFMEESNDCNNMPVKGGGKIIDYLIQRGESLIVDDITKDSRFSDHVGGKSYRSSSFIASPIMANRRIIGVISVTDKENGERFTKEDLAVLNIFTRYIGTAFSNYRMYKKKLYENIESSKDAFLKEIYSALYSSEYNKVIRGNGISVRHHMEASTKFGGDFFDYIKVDEHIHFLLMSDTTGSGFGSIINIAFFKSIVASNIKGKKEFNLKQLFEKVNEDLSKVIPQTTFFTAFAALIDTRAKKVDYINFGFPSPMMIRKLEQVPEIKILKGGNLMLGIFNDANIEVHSEEYDANDLFIIYSDGIIKNLNYLQEKYPIMDIHKRIISDLEGEREVEQYSQLIFDDVKTFYGYKELEDDISIAVVKFDRTST